MLNDQIILSQPSSAVVERVFSAFKRIMHPSMERALDDYVKSSLFASCNQARGAIRYLENHDEGEVAEEELDIIGDDLAHLPLVPDDPADANVNDVNESGSENGDVSGGMMMKRFKTLELT